MIVSIASKITPTRNRAYLRSEIEKAKKELEQVKSIPENDSIRETVLWIAQDNLRVARRNLRKLIKSKKKFLPPIKEESVTFDSNDWDETDYESDEAESLFEKLPKKDIKQMVVDAVETLKRKKSR